MASPRVSDTRSPSADDRIAAAERQLALVDRMIALEVRVAELSTGTALSPSDQLLVEQRLAELRGTLTWRAGRVATAPLRAARRVAGRGARD